METNHNQNKDWIEPDWDYLNWAWDQEEKWQKSLPKFTDKELLEIFPEAKEIIPEKIQEWEEEKSKIHNIIKKKLTLVKNKVSDEFWQWFWRWAIKMTNGEEFLIADGHIKRLKRLLSVTENNEYKGRFTEEQIQQALAVPIENLINQPLRKSGKALVGLCPLHNEKHPSFYVYPETNRWWCYGGCGQGGDVINFIKLLQGYSFKEAVQYLIGK